MCFIRALQLSHSRVNRAMKSGRRDSCWQERPMTLASISTRPQMLPLKVRDSLKFWRSRTWRVNQYVFSSLYSKSWLLSLLREGGKGRLPDWLIDSLIHQSIDWLAHRWIDWLIDYMAFKRLNKTHYEFDAVYLVKSSGKVTNSFFSVFVCEPGECGTVPEKDQGEVFIDPFKRPMRCGNHSVLYFHIKY